ncbi:hypothetical protein [Lentzea sp.]|uniref:hypothetical protein n=1 Tax=Lentzea sp. TaxID=56099 RepID=UPI002ED43063
METIDGSPDLVAGMNALTGQNLVDLDQLRRQIVVRDQQVDNPFTKDLQVMGIRNSLVHSGDSLARTAPLHRSSTRAAACSPDGRRAARRRPKAPRARGAGLRPSPLPAADPRAPP